MALTLGGSNNLATISTGLVRLNNELGKNLSRLSSGLSISNASDNPAGLSVSEQLSSDITSLNQSLQNISAGSSLLRTADGSLSGISNLLIRGRELAVRGSGTLNPSARSAINLELQSIIQEVDRIAGNSEFNGQKLLNGELAPTATNKVKVQAGKDAGANNQISLNGIKSVDSNSLGIASVNLTTAENSRNAVTAFDSAISDISQARSNIGAISNRFDSAADNLGTLTNNLSSAQNSIIGLDFSKESASFRQNKVLLETGLSSLNSARQTQETLIGNLLNILG